MTTYPIYCSGCGVVGLGAVELPAGVDPAAVVDGMLCTACGDAYLEQLAAGTISPGQPPT